MPDAGIAEQVARPWMQPTVMIPVTGIPQLNRPPRRPKAWQRRRNVASLRAWSLLMNEYPSQHSAHDGECRKHKAIGNA